MKMLSLPPFRPLLLFVFGLCLCAVAPSSSLSQEAESRGRILDRHGEALATNSETGSRTYPHADIASHLTGYLKKGRTVPVGAHGLEKSLNEALAKGADVSLTIDHRIQKICSDAFPNDVEGSVVVIDPRSGEILAMASFPTFDANDFVPAITQEKFRAYLDDVRKPLFNRSIHPSTPGSVFMVPVAVAAAVSGIDQTPFTCTGSVKLGDRNLKCWIINRPQRQHSKQVLAGALVNSCNAWFYQAAQNIGISPIQSVAETFGLGRTTACGLPNEADGFLPSPEKLKAQGKNWGVGDLVMLSIGQGRILTTPVQIASVGATLAGDGKVRPPRLLADDKREVSGNLFDTGLVEDQWQSIRDAFRRNVNDAAGTATKAKSEAIEIAGKSATAQTGGLPGGNIGWFTGFAPFEAPTLAICVQVEKSSGGTAAEIAKQILEQAHALNGE